MLPPTLIDPIHQARQSLATARQASNPRSETQALIDLGVIGLRGGNHRQAAGLLQQARILAEELNDRALHLDATDHLGTALFQLGQAPQAIDLLNQAVVDAREMGDRYREKAALEHLGMCLFGVRDFALAENSWKQSLSLAVDLNDPVHEAELLWLLAIVHAECSLRGAALERGREALRKFQLLGNPFVPWLTEHLLRYEQRTEERLAKPAESSALDSVLGPWSVSTNDLSASLSPPAPGLLRMAFSAVKSISRFFTSGFETVTEATYQSRLAECATCEHHTGVRCTRCGCFTSIKAWMPHEPCPLGRWDNIAHNSRAA